MMNWSRSSYLVSASVGALLAALPAYAQGGSNAGQAASADSIETVVVTGTLIRNVVPAGVSPIDLNAKAITATGATSTDQLLATIPQLQYFGTLQTANAGGTQLTVNRINIRSLPQGVGASSPTLVLLDGHRMVGEGVKQSYPDPDVIPPALIERVAVVPDGGSAIYGSDAVGGVVNFITKDDFNGVQLGVREGVGDSYTSTDVNFAAGTSWTGGSGYIGYNYSYHGSVYGRDRSYIKDINYTTGLPSDLSCTPANAVVGGATYAVVGGTSLSLSNANLCDRSKAMTFYPEETRHSFMAGFHQELTDSLEFSLKAYYSMRNDRQDNGPIQGSGTVTSSSPNYISTGGGSTANQTVYFDFAPVGGEAVIRTKLWAYGITPKLTWDFGHNWEARAFYNYGQSQTKATDPGYSSGALGPDIATGTINPYNIAGSSTSALSQVLDWTTSGIGKDTLNNARLTVDGPLFSLPGGDVRVAVGGEYIGEDFKGKSLIDTRENYAAAPLNSASRNVKAAFAELHIPVISPDNGVPFINSFTIAASERYDSYSDFGGNWSPNFGVTLKPVSWIKLRGRWNKSFQAPSVVQLAQAASPQASVYPGYFAKFVPLLLNPSVAFNNGPIVAIQGTVSPLEPQKATIYDYGFDISPPIVNGLDIHFTYYNIDYKGQIGTPPLGYGQFYGISSYSSLYKMLPTIGQLQTFLTNAGVPASQIANVVAQVNAQGGNAYVVADVRARNLGVTKVDGYDFGFDYHHDVSFGTAYASFHGTYNESWLSAPDGVTFGTNQAGVDGMSRFTFVSTAGATVGDNFRAQLTWNHRGGFNLSTPAALNQTFVGAFDTFDLYTQYDLKREDLPPISFSLGISNIFNTHPPLYRGNTQEEVGGGYWNGSTIGRVFQLGATVKF